MLKTANVPPCTFVTEKVPDRSGFQQGRLELSPRLPYQLLKVTNLKLFLLLVLSLAVSARSFSQKISISGKRLPLTDVFAAVEKQTGLFVFANKSLFQGTSPVTIAVHDMPVTIFLDSILKEQPLSFRIDGNNIFLSRKAVNTSQASINAKPLTLADFNGVLVNAETKDPVANASIMVKNAPGNGVTSDASGHFSLANLPDNAVLMISSIGFNAVEISFARLSSMLVGGKLQEKNIVVRKNAQASFIFEMRATQSALDEVVVKGYYETSKRFNTGSVGSVKSATFESQPVGNPLQALIGRVPGVDVTQQSGMPGGGITIRIRGQNSLRPDANEPLYVVDGVPVSSGFANQEMPNSNSYFIFKNGGNPLSSINPSSIESIEILKDADATAIYGSRGANGVVLIITKKGKAGKARFDINYSNGGGKITRYMKLLDRRQYLDMRYEAIKNDGMDINEVDAVDLTGWDTTRNTNWQKELLGGTARYSDLDASITGGDKNTGFTLGMSYWKETTVFPGDFSDRKISGRLNLYHNSNDQKFKINLAVNYLSDNNYLPVEDNVTSALTLPPVAPAMYNADGTINFANSSWSNPALAWMRPNSGVTKNFNASGTMSYQLLKPLRISITGGYSNRKLEAIQLYPYTAVDPAYIASIDADARSSYITDNSTEVVNLEPQLNFDKKIGTGKLNAFIGGSVQQTMQTGFELKASGFLDDALIEDVNSAALIDGQSSQYSKYRYMAGFGGVNYNIDNKYVLNLIARRDGSSRFGPGRQFGNFGAIGAAWLFTEEKWVKSKLPFLSFGKLRLSYGITGSDAIQDYGYLSRFTSMSGRTAGVYDGTRGLEPANLMNPDFGWETNKKADLELDLAFLDGAVQFNTTYYRNRSGNQLVGYPLPNMTGYSSVQANLPATVQNTGLELELTTRNINSKSFQWTSSFNITLPRNKLIAFPDLETSSYANTYVVGQPLTIVKALIVATVDPKTGEPVFAEKTGETIVFNIGKKYYGGLQNSFHYKNFQVDVFFQFAKQTGRFRQLNDVEIAPPGFMANIPAYLYEGRWKEPGSQTDINKLTQSTTSEAYQARIKGLDIRNFSDISYARLKNVSFSYSLSKDWLQHIHMQNIRFYVNAQNLLTITGYKGMDPENQGYALPPLKVIVIGCNISF